MIIAHKYLASYEVRILLVESKLLLPDFSTVYLKKIVDISLISCELKIIIFRFIIEIVFILKEYFQAISIKLQTIMIINQ